jgi:hypothetical protein
MAPRHQGPRQVVNCIEPREGEDEQTLAALVVDEDEQRTPERRRLTTEQAQPAAVVTPVGTDGSCGFAAAP